MNLQKLIEQYVVFRQSLGERFHTNGSILRAFGRSIGATADVDDVCHEQVSVFLAGTGPITSAWHKRRDALVGFYRYASSRGYVASVPLPSVVPKLPPSFVPYIYTREEIRRLLRATDTYPYQTSCEPPTVRTILLLLYGTGVRIREALSLNSADVDWGSSMLTIRKTKFFKSRLVPFGPDLGRVLGQYAKRPQAHGRTPSDEPPFFTTRTRTRVHQHTFTYFFRRLCEHAGIRRHDGARYQPRLHDLRHTFAVHRLTSWYEQGADVQKLLPQLSTYLGHVNLAGTQVYLSMTPDLLQQACKRFERYTGEEGDHE